jgi:hypothetical protein
MNKEEMMMEVMTMWREGRISHGEALQKTAIFQSVTPEQMEIISQLLRDETKIADELLLTL